MKTFLTHYFTTTRKSSKVPMTGPDISAETWDEALRKAESLSNIGITFEIGGPVGSESRRFSGVI